MQLFYTTGIDNGFCSLGEEESRHCAKVLRLKIGDEIDLTDGKGRLYHAALEEIHAGGCRAEIITATQVPPSPWHLHIALAPPKNPDRFEWFLEKATEIGIGEVTPLLCRRSERVSLKMQRLEKVMVSAIKQSLRAWLPVLNPPVGFSELVSSAHTSRRYIAYCATGNEDLLSGLYVPGSDATILVGPEGDFTPEEAALAQAGGFVAVSLGRHRLRTETAGIVACHTISLLNDITKQAG